MIKKLLLIPIALLFLKSVSFGQACNPDPQYTNPSTQAGVYPDSVTNFDTAYVGIPYTQLVTIVIPPDTQAFPPPFPPVPWDSTILSSVTGLPASMSYACWNNSSKPNRCAWNGNSIGCAIISGTPTISEVGVHSLTFNTDNYVGGQTSPNAYAITYYKIVVLNGNAVNENPRIQTLLQNNPNPFSDKSDIMFTSEDMGIAKFKVYNMVGTVIKEYDIAVKKGMNKLEIDAKDYDSGVYFYSLSYGNNAFTRKMIVKK
jgi:hypothetical protein